MAAIRDRVLRRLLHDSSGTTLLELVVAIGIIVIMAGMVGTSVFQVLALERTWRNNAVATKHLRHAGSWFSIDAINAESTDLVDGAPAASGTVLTWTDSSGQPKVATYVLSGADLVREMGGESITVARRVVSAEFSLSGSMITFGLEVEASGGGTASTTIQTFLRRQE